MISIIKKIFSNKSFQDIIFIFLLSLTPLLWFKGDSLMFGHDNVYPLNPSVFLEGRLFTWIEHGFGYSQSLIMGTIPTHLIDAVPFLLGFPLQISQKMVYIFWFFMIGLSAYILASVINRESRVFKLIATTFYQFNFFILQGWFIGERTKFSAYIAFALIIAVFFKVYKGELKPWKGAIFNSFILFIFNAGGLYGIPLYGGFFIGLTIFVLLFSFFSFAKKELHVIKRLILTIVLSLLGFILINSYYLLPTLPQIASQYIEGVGKIGGFSGSIDWASEISANASFVNLFRLQGIADWYDNPEHPYAKVFINNPIFIAISFLWPLLIFSTLLLYEKKKNFKFILYFFLVYLLGMFFAAGTHPPLGFVYAFLIQYVPGFVIFRSPFFKFAPAIFLASSFLLAYFADFFSGLHRRLIFISLFCIILLYHFPYFTGNFFNWRHGFSTRNDLPNYIVDFGKWAEQEKDAEEKILLLPPANKSWQYDIYNWGYLSLQSLPTLVTNQGVVANGDKLNNREQELVSMYYLVLEEMDIDLVKKLSSLLRIRYLVIRNDFNSSLEWAPTKSPEVYRKILEENFGLLPIRQFGEWTIYRLNFNELPKIFTTSIINVVDGHYKDLYLQSFTNKNLNFLIKKEQVNYKESKFANEMISKYFIPACLNCRHEQTPFINLPDRTIPPESPLYSLMLFFEQGNYKNKSPREMIYADLGISLKRLGEIRKAVFEKRPVKIELFDRYLELLVMIDKRFKELSLFRDRFEVSEDIGYYLKAQRKYLLVVLGSNVTSGYQAEKVEQIFDAMSSVEKTIDPYLFKGDSSVNRLYEYSIDNPGLFELLLRKENVDTFAKDKFNLRLQIDGKSIENLRLEPAIGRDDWLSFGKMSLTEGLHRMILSLPELSNHAEGFKLDIVNANSESNCFVSHILDFDNRKVYKAKLEYFNDFSNEIYFYIRETQKGEEKIAQVVKLEDKLEKSLLETLIYSSLDTDAITIKICSKNLTMENVNDILSLSVKEVVHPELIFVPADENIPFVQEVLYTKINPTKYTFEIARLEEPVILTFLNRYDPQWRLVGFEKNHFRMDGYANAWLIDDLKTNKFILEYRPQVFFNYGVVISFVSVAGGLVLLLKKDNKNNDKR